MHVPLISELGRRRRIFESKASLGYIARQMKQNSDICQLWWFMHIILAVRRQRQEDSELQVRL